MSPIQGLSALLRPTQLECTKHVAVCDLMWSRNRTLAGALTLYRVFNMKSRLGLYKLTPTMSKSSPQTPHLPYVDSVLIIMLIFQVLYERQWPGHAEQDPREIQNSQSTTSH